MSRRENTGQNSPSPRTLQLPSIEVTLEDGRTEAAAQVELQEHGDAQSSSRQGQHLSNRRLGRLVPLRSWKRSLFIIPHSITGLLLLAVGGVVQSLYNSISDEESPHVERDQKLEKPCDSVDCSPYLSLMCIAVGSMFIFCAISGFLMVMKVKEFVSCHLIWLSLSALSSITFVAACVVGVKAPRKKREGITECISVILVAATIEMVFCIINLCLLTALNNETGISSGSTRSAPGDGEGSSRRNLQETSSRRENEQRDNPDNEGANTRRNQHQSVNRTSPRTILRTGYSPRRRRSGQAIRDRNSLHPGYHHQVRNRMRRRPILRAQNHYVLVPAAFGRPRASSRVGRRQSAARRMPMFVLSNHDSYVQALNQSIEALETQPNRGSVPGDVLPSLSAVQSNRVERASSAPRKPLEKTDSLETNLSSSSLESSRILHPVSATTSDAETVHSMSQRQRHQAEGVEGQRSTLIGAGYSVTRRTDNAFKIERQTYGSETDAECSNNASHLYSPRGNLPSNNARPASVLEDSVFQLTGWERSGSSQCMTDSEYSSQRKDEVKPPIPERATRSRFYNAASEGDFTIIRNACEPRGRMGNTSVSSDSGIADAPHTATSRFARSHYRNFPPKVSPMVSMEMTEITLSNSHFHHSPVSPQTPSYENLNSQSGVVGQGNFAFASESSQNLH